MPRLRRLLLCLLLVLDASVAAAGDDAAAARAIQLGRGALEAYNAGAWAKAYEDFAAADSIAASPVFVLYMARCQRNLGHLRRARELYRRVNDQMLSEAAPKPWRDAVEAARAELAAVNSRIASVVLDIEGDATNARIALDGTTLELERTRRPLELDPGEHELDIQHPNGRRERRRFVLRDGDVRVRQVVVLSPPATAGSPALTPGRRRQSTGRAGSGTQWVGYAATAAAGGALLVGAASGLVAFDQKQKIKERCPQLKGCAPDLRDDVERGRLWADVSTVSFVAAGAFLVLGGTFLFIIPDPRGARGAIGARGTF